MPKTVNLEDQIEGDEGSGKVPFDDGDGTVFTDKREREHRVEGYGPYAIAPLAGDTDSHSEAPPEGFLKRNNVRDRI